MMPTTPFDRSINERSPLLLLAAALIATAAGASSELDLRLQGRELVVEPAGSITLPATTLTTYQYDDSDFEGTSVIRFNSGGVVYENELAQRFTLSDSGTLRWAEVCLANVASSTQSFDFVVYVRRDSGGLPGATIDRTPSSRESLPSKKYSCFRLTVSNFRVGAGSIWVSVEWTPGGADNDIALMADDSNSRGQRAYRAKGREGEAYSDWRPFAADFVLAIRLGVEHSTSAPPPPDPPTDPPGGSTLHDGQFELAFLASANNRNHDGQVANWSSRKGILFWLFDAENPEALVKVLDGRLTNGFWWMDVAVTSDLRTATQVRHQGTSASWSVQTGRAREFGITDSDIADELIHCATPLDRSDRQCAIVGLGTTVSLRDAWTAQGWIPSKYYSDTSQAASAATFALFRAQRPEGPEDH